MAKFFKSIFQTEKRKGSSEEEGEEERGDTPPMDGRRQLSISRSGRMRQANKKRHSLTLELYGDTIDIDVVEKPKSVEYHVHCGNTKAPVLRSETDNRLESDSDVEIIEDEPLDENMLKVTLEQAQTALAVTSGAKSPEEEIDNAFEIIDKT